MISCLPLASGPLVLATTFTSGRLSVPPASATATSARSNNPPQTVGFMSGSLKTPRSRHRELDRLRHLAYALGVTNADGDTDVQWSGFALGPRDRGLDF